MKVLFLSRLYWPHKGGVEKHIEMLSSELIKKGHKVKVLTTNYNNILENEEIRNGVQIVRFRQPKIKYLGLLSSWLWLIKNYQLIVETDIIHVHDVFIWFLPFRLLFPRKKVYITFHGWEGKYPIPLFNLIQKKSAYLLTNGNICVGKYLEKYYHIKADIFIYGATEIPQRFSKKKKNSIVYVGSLSDIKWLSIFLTSLKYLSGYEIDFCGDGPLASKCARYGKVHGFINPDRLLAKAKYCLAGGYLVIFEALANKCIVLASYENDFQKNILQLTPFKNLIIIEKKPRILAKKINYFNNNNYQARKFANKGYQWVKDWSWEKVANDYIKLWNM